MSDQPPQRPILHRKTTQTLVFVGVIGWTSFFLTTAIWKRSDNKRKKAMKELHIEVEKISESMQVGESELEEKKLTTQHLTEHVSKLSEQLKNRQKLADKAVADEKAKLETQINIFNGHLENAAKRLTSPDLDKAEINFWAATLTTNAVSNEKLKQRFHSLLAEAYFHAGDTVKTKYHLTESKHFDPKQEQRLLSQLDIELSMQSLRDAVKTKQSATLIRKKLNTATSLIEQLKKDPAQLTRAHKLHSELLTLETKSALNFPPKEAIKLLQPLIEKQRELTKDTSTPLEIKLGYLDTLKSALLVSEALGQSSVSEKLKKETNQAIAIILKAHPGNKPTYQAQATIQLMVTDQLFSEGEPSEISKSVAKLLSTAKKLEKDRAVIIKAAAAGHKASILYERGQTTNAQNTLKSAITQLKALNKKSPNNTYASFRLGILLWQKAQLTTSQDLSFDSLGQSAATLQSALKIGPELHEHAIRQFLAMVEGDLGHLTSQLGKKEAAKTHFNNALTQWKAIEKSWGQTEESKEGIRYCSWRVKNL